MRLQVLHVFFWKTTMQLLHIRTYESSGMIEVDTSVEDDLKGLHVRQNEVLCWFIAEDVMEYRRI